VLSIEYFQKDRQNYLVETSSVKKQELVTFLT